MRLAPLKLAFMLLLAMHALCQSIPKCALNPVQAPQGLLEFIIELLAEAECYVISHHSFKCIWGPTTEMDATVTMGTPTSNGGLIPSGPPTSIDNNQVVTVPSGGAAMMVIKNPTGGTETCKLVAAL